jgi:hypoxanthine phosphoribosyltransferase
MENYRPLPLQQITRIDRERKMHSHLTLFRVRNNFLSSHPLLRILMKIKHLEFTSFISEATVKEKIIQLARQINEDYIDKTPVFLPVLNGSFIFAADLMKEISIPCRVSFVKVSSYSGTASTGQLKSLIGLEESLFNQHVLIIEDIVDTGFTLQKIVEELQTLGTKSVEVISLLRKKPAREKGLKVRYIGFDIDDEFVLGYGLDFDGLGRNLKEIYRAQP